MQLGRSGEFLACKGGSRTTNQNPQQPLIGIIFTNADPRYTGRFDDKQGGDIIVTMERLREAIAFNTELVDESTWLWLTSEIRAGGGKGYLFLDILAWCTNTYFQQGMPNLLLYTH